MLMTMNETASTRSPPARAAGRLRKDRADGEAPDPRPGIDRLGHDGAAEEIAGLEADQSHDRDQGVAQHVPDHDGALAQALGPGGADVVGAQDLEGRGTGHAATGPMI